MGIPLGQVSLLVDAVEVCLGCSGKVNNLVEILSCDSAGSLRIVGELLRGSRQEEIDEGRQEDSLNALQVSRELVLVLILFSVSKGEC